VSSSLLRALTASVAPTRWQSRAWCTVAGPGPPRGRPSSGKIRPRRRDPTTRAADRCPFNDCPLHSSHVCTPYPDDVCRRAPVSLADQSSDTTRTHDYIPLSDFLFSGALQIGCVEPYFHRLRQKSGLSQRCRVSQTTPPRLTASHAVRRATVSHAVRRATADSTFQTFQPPCRLRQTRWRERACPANSRSWRGPVMQGS